jgi:hypothetical protein
MSAEDSFVEAALAGQQIALTLLAKLVMKNLISPVDAAEVLEEVLLQLQGWQLSFPLEYHQGFDLAC